MVIVVWDVMGIGIRMSTVIAMELEMGTGMEVEMGIGMKWV